MQARLTGLVTIVVLTHNRRDELCRSLEHLQALPERPAIVVVDNGSTDDTAACVRTRFPDVTLVLMNANLGAAGRNHGADRARTRYVAFSDDDTWWAPGALRLAVDMLERHPKVAVLTASILVGAEARPDPACLAMAQSPLPPVPGIGPRLIGFMAGACVMRTRAFRQAGGYWPPLFIGGEESLLALDVLDAGGEIAYAPDLHVHHWPSSKRDGSLRGRMILRNAIWTACLRLPWRLAWQRSRVALAAMPDRTQQWAILSETLTHLAMLLKARRVVNSDTCKLLETVWEHEAAAQRRG